MEYKWGHKRRFNAYSNYFKSKFGERIQKLSVNAGFTCPNRDGKVAYGGCSFCNNSAFSPSYCNNNSIKAQIEKGIDFHSSRYKKAEKYLVYFQSFSNTYGTLENLKKNYQKALNNKGIIGLVIGTRPDCIDKYKLDYLAKLSEKYYITIEYGIESCYNKTLKRINRGHTFEQAEKAIRETKKAGLRTGAHLIMGLPGESRNEVLDSSKIISELPLDNIKFHQLQIMEGTNMYKEYMDSPGDFSFFELEEYIDFIVKYIEKLNPGFVIERFAGEAPPKYNRTPVKWNVRNDVIIKKVEDKLEQINSWQGKFYKNVY